jgi:hypothetical protein
MDDIKLSYSNIGFAVTAITKLVADNPNINYRLSIKQWREKRSLNQNSLQHVWYDEISKQAIKRGINKDKHVVKRDIKGTLLGWEQYEHTDIVTGEITVKYKLKETSKLDVGEAQHYMDRIVAWAYLEGYTLTIPEDCDYQKLINQQDE